MTEKPSRTSNHQRLNEMMCHLTPHKAVIPYNVCFDSDDNIWVASKGGLFKFDRSGGKLLFERKNAFPKKMAPYSQVLVYKTQIIYVTCEDKTALTEFRILNVSDGTMEHEHFIDGKVHSLAVTENGDLFITKQPIVGVDESAIWKSHMECPVAWEELCSTFDESFQTLCAFDNDTLAVMVISTPVNIYSKQCIKWVNAKNGQQLGKFSTCGKADGQVFFPRCMRRWNDALLVMDKTGRIQKFTRDGKFGEISAKIDDYIGNGFTLRNDDEVVIACSGIVLNQNNESICDDWLEAIRLDGSRWTPP